MVFYKGHFTAHFAHLREEAAFDPFLQQINRCSELACYDDCRCKPERRQQIPTNPTESIWRRRNIRYKSLQSVKINMTEWTQQKECFFCNSIP